MLPILHHQNIEFLKKELTSLPEGRLRKKFQKVLTEYVNTFEEYKILSNIDHDCVKMLDKIESKEARLESLDKGLYQMLGGVLVI